MRKDWVLAMSSFGVAIALMEIIVRGYYTATDHLPPHPDVSVRQEWQWAREHLAAGAAVLPGSAQFDARYGWVVDRDADQWLARASAGTTYQGEVSEARGTGTPRLLFVGDSYTFGVYVDQRDSYPTVLQRDHLPNWEVLNFGVPGYGPDQMELLFEELGARYQPDVAVLSVYTEGASRATRRFEYYAKPYFELAADDSLTLQGVPVIPPEYLYDDYRTGVRAIARFPYSYLYGAVAAGVTRLMTPSHFAATDERGRLLAAILERFRDQAVARGARAFILVIPDDSELPAGADGNGVDQLVRDTARRLDVPCLSLLDGLRAEDANHPESPVFRARADGGHFTAAGHAVAAKLLRDALRDTGLAP